MENPFDVAPAGLWWELSPDRTALLMSARCGPGTLRSRTGWPQAATDEQVSAALRGFAQTVEARVAQGPIEDSKDLVKRWGIDKPVDVMIGMISGPPTWWFPKAEAEFGRRDDGRLRVRLMIGWFRRAVWATVSVGRKTG